MISSAANFELAEIDLAKIYLSEINWSELALLLIAQSHIVLIAQSQSKCHQVAAHNFFPIEQLWWCIDNFQVPDYKINQLNNQLTWTQRDSKGLKWPRITSAMKRQKVRLDV